MTDKRYPANEIWPIARRLADFLAPACQRIDVAGSLRRGAETVKDIEIVAQPKLVEHRDLFGRVADFESELDPLLSRLITGEELWRGEKQGERQKWFYVPGLGIKLDLYIVLPPAQFGWILLLRTGPASFSKRAVTHRKYGGLMPSHLHSKDGAIRRVDKSVIETPEEVDVFNLFEINFVEPGERG